MKAYDEMRTLLEAMTPGLYNEVQIISEDDPRELRLRAAKQTEQLRSDVNTLISSIDAVLTSRQEMGDAFNGERLATRELSRFMQQLESAVQDWDNIAGIEFQ